MQLLSIATLPNKLSKPYAGRSEIRRTEVRTTSQMHHNTTIQSPNDLIAQLNADLHELIDECANSTVNDCDPNASCVDNPLSYECLCRDGYFDVSIDPVKKPGRKCIKLSLTGVVLRMQTSNSEMFCSSPVCPEAVRFLAHGVACRISKSKTFGVT
ncbi:calcium binding EGF domain protein [Dictyocaulus viviparus]|uniref:Calcium binding EGF domain protein n=1 Tax=Dictyocaulus viviparus TaxID=29172 RepID=A0A0D8XYW6_DICVI|nr:calcium binding EGF domain protein [Dictyocaulus viviparus]